MFLLDTNVVIAILARRNAGCLERFRLETARGAVLLLSSLVLYELRVGVAKSDRRESSRALLDAFLAAPLTIVDFDAEDAAEAAEIRAHLERAGTPIGPYDILIAAQARRRGARLVTANRRELTRVPELDVEDWSA